MFMGTEFAQHNEWNVETSLDWHIAEHPQRKGPSGIHRRARQLYKESNALWRGDPGPESFEWIECNDKDNTILSYLRRDGADYVIVVLNFTPVPRDEYRIGVPSPGRYVERLSSDDLRFGAVSSKPPPWSKRIRRRSTAARTPSACAFRRSAR